MELYQLRTFVVVAEEKSITRAAQRLFTTPPSISAHIKALEEQLGVGLFTRTPKGMAITAKGELLRQKALATLAAAQDLVNHATELQDELIGTVSLGLNGPVNSLRIPGLLEHLGAHAPGVEVRLVQSNSGEIIDKLGSGELDLGFVFGEVGRDTLTAQRLGSLELVVAIPPRWAEELEQGDWPDLARFPWVYSDKYCPFQVITDRLLEQHGLKCARVTATNDEGAKQALVTAGLGIAMLLEAEAREATARGELAIWHGEPPSAELSLACLATRRDDPLLEAVRLGVLDAWRPLRSVGDEAAQALG